MEQQIDETLIIHGYKLVKYLNHGSFGNVYIVRSLKYNIDFVCKVAINYFIDQSSSLSFMHEAEILTMLNHPNIVKIYDIFSENGKMFIILEYCSGGSLKDVISQGQTDPKRIIQYAFEIVNALEYMHNLGYAHCDIKPSNILLDEYGRAKIADFGLSRLVDHSKNEEISCGSLSYMAPEIIMSLGTDPFKSDIWAFGITLYYLATGKLPYTGKSYKKLMSEIYLGYTPITENSLKVNEMAKVLDMVIEACLKINPAERPTFSDVKIILQQAFKKSSRSRSYSTKSLFKPNISHVTLKLRNKIAVISSI